MKRLLNTIVAYRMLFRCMPHMFVTQWRQVLGRWYYFRDRPDWFVDAIAQLHGHHTDKATPQTLEYVAEACAERERRINQALRVLGQGEGTP